MWIVRMLLGALIILAVLGFALQNTEQTASVMIVKWQSPVLPLYIFLYFAFGAGMIFWALVSIYNILKLKGNIHRLQKENKKIRDELNRLRNVDIDVQDTEVAGPAEPEPESAE